MTFCRSIITIASLLLLIPLSGCDQPVASDESTETSAVKLGSSEELHARLGELGEDISPTNPKTAVTETHVVLKNGTELAKQDTGDDPLLTDSPSEYFYELAGVEKATATSTVGDGTGAFVRNPTVIGIDENIVLPPADATGSSTDATTNDACLEPLAKCGGGGGGGGGGGTTTPSLLGTSALRFDNTLREGYQSSEGFSQTSNGTYVDEISATVQTDVNINNGQYTDTSVPYTFRRFSNNQAKAISSHYHYAGNTSYDANSDHSLKDGATQRTTVSSAGASTNFSSPSCAPFPVAGDNGPNFSQTSRFSLEWQTICPYKNKVLQLTRTSGPGGQQSSAQVETSGDGWSIKPFEAWRGLYMNDGDYQWTIRAKNESASRSGTFSIDGGSLCRPDASVTGFVAPSSTSPGQITISVSGCTPDGEYRFRAFAVGVSGASNQVGSATVQISGSGSFNLGLQSGQYTGGTLRMTRTSPHNGSATVDVESF